MTGIYIHVPFCLRKCPYCDFYSIEYGGVLAEKYVDAVCRNISALKDKNITADTVYLGGGTPSLLTPDQVYRILDCVQNNVHLCDAEITIEANPSSLDFQKLRDYKSVGINRLSVGVQSADDRQLEFLGRLHTADKAAKVVLDAERVGFDNISCDLMLGLAGQDIASLKRSADVLLALPISHLSAYMLKIEQGTAFDSPKIKKAVADDELMCDLYLALCEKMYSAGWEHYEISNFSKKGRRSRHNMKYWTLEEYIGIGPAAHSDFGGSRYSCPRDFSGFINSRVQKNVLEDERPDRFSEYVMLSLRLSEGIAYDKLEALGSREAADAVFRRAIPLVKNGLVICSDGTLRLTDNGFLLSNSIIVHLLDC